MLVSGEKDHNCIYDYVNSTVLLPNYFDQLYFGNTRIMQRAVGTEIPLDSTNTFFAVSCVGFPVKSSSNLIRITFKRGRHNQFGMLRIA